jgi:hypothetical protein
MDAKEMKDNNMVVLDLIPSLTISDPTTYMNLLNSMGNTQEFRCDTIYASSYELNNG